MLNNTATEYQDLVHCLVEQRRQVSKTEQQITAYRQRVGNWVGSEAENALEYLTTYPQRAVCGYWRIHKPKKQIVKPSDIQKTYSKVHLSITDRIWPSNRISTVAVQPLGCSELELCSVQPLGCSELELCLSRQSNHSSDFANRLCGLDFQYLVGWFQIVRALMLSPVEQRQVLPWDVVDLICDYVPPTSCEFVNLNDQKLHEHLSQVPGG